MFIKRSIFLALFPLFLIFTGCNNNSTEPELSTQFLQENTYSLASVNFMSELTNGNMEDGTNGYWRGGLLNSNYSFEYSNEESVSPNHSLKITALGSDNKSFGYWAQTFNADEYIGKKITVKVSAKYDNVVGDGIMLVLRGDDAEHPEGIAEAFNTTQNKVKFSGDSDWKTIEIYLDPVSENIKSLTVYMLISAKEGSVYFDNLSISITDPTPETQGFVNGDVESGTYFPNNWWIGSNSNGQINLDWDDSEYISPNHSIKINSDTKADNFSFWAQTFSAGTYVGNNLSLDVNIKADNLDGKGVYLVLRGDDTAKPSGAAEFFVTTQGKESITGSFDWTKRSVSSDVVPDNILSLTVYLIYGDSTSGAVYFDDIELNTN